jgi:hypothetical protein
MKTIKNVTLYQCEYCKKDYKRKHFAISHEPKCRKNPANDQKCLHGCRHLEKKEVEIYFDILDCYNIKELLYCNAKEEFVHPFWVEGYLQEDIKDEIPNNPMPEECDKYKFL